MSATSQSQSEPSRNGLARRPHLEMIWVVFTRRGALTSFATEAEADHEADLYFRTHPHELIWVSAWPAQLEYYPRRPWCYVDALMDRTAKARKTEEGR